MTIVYLKKTSQIDNKLWSFATLTARRFTVELKISNEMWQNFISEKQIHETLPAGESTPNHVGL